MCLQVIDSYNPSLGLTNGSIVSQPSYSFAVSGVTDYTGAQESNDFFLTQTECWTVVQKMFDLGNASTMKCGDKDDKASLACQLKNFVLGTTPNNNTKTCCSIYLTNQQEPDVPSTSPTAAPTGGTGSTTIVTSAAADSTTTGAAATNTASSASPTPAPTNSPSKPPTEHTQITTAYFYDRSGRSVAMFFSEPSNDYTCSMVFQGNRAPDVIHLVKESTDFNAATAVAAAVAVEDIVDSHYELVSAYANECESRIDDGAYDSDTFEAMTVTALVFLSVEFVIVVVSMLGRLTNSEDGSMSFLKEAWYYYLAKFVFVASKTFCFVAIIYLLNQNRHEGCPRYAPSSVDDGMATEIGVFVFLQYISLFVEGMSRLAWPGTHDDAGKNHEFTLSMSLL